MSIIEDRNQSAVTVHELIIALEELPTTATVGADGCDCTNPVVSLEYDETSHITTLKVEP